MTVCCVFERRITKAKHMFLMYTGGAMMNVNRQHNQELKIIYAGCPFLPFHASSSSSSSHRLSAPKRFFALMKNLFLSFHTFTEQNSSRFNVAMSINFYKKRILMCSCDQTPKLDSIASFRVEAEQTERKTSTSFVRLENVKFIICEPFCVQLDEP